MKFLWMWFGGTGGSITSTQLKGPWFDLELRTLSVFSCVQVDFLWVLQSPVHKHAAMLLGVNG